jgi:hypothetical protein
MGHHSIMEQLLEKVRSLTPSYGTPPFTITSIYEKDGGKKVITSALPYHLLVISTYKDYNLCDLRDYLSCSSQYQTLPPGQAAQWLNQRVAQLSAPLELRGWQLTQTDMALGMLLHAAAQQGILLKKIPESTFGTIIWLPENNCIHSVLYYQR